jgi:hypothetical protein
VTGIVNAPAPVLATTRDDRDDHRGSWVPTPSMIATRLMELRRRRGLMITIASVVIGLPSVFLAIRLILHAVDPKTYGTAGSQDIFTGIVAGPLYVFGFIVAAMLGATAGSSDLTDGMFRHLVVTGRSRLALYFARIPAGLAIIGTALAMGYTIVCLVCCLSAPSQVSYSGLNVPYGLSQQGFVTWSVQHTDQVVCDYYYQAPLNVPCGPNGVVPASRLPKGVNVTGQPTQAQLRVVAAHAAAQDYAEYARLWLTPSISLMVGVGLWLLLEATVGFIVGLGLGSLLGQRTVAVILLIVLEIVLTPILLQARIPHLINLQRAVVGIGTAHLEPNGLTQVFGGGGGPNARAMLLPETTVVAVIVVCAWLVGWTALGAWRMKTRDA